jgi:hypothetical protein
MVGVFKMTTEAQNLLQTFELLQEADKREVAAEIMRRSVSFDVPPLSDDQLTAIADELFLELDKEDSKDASS